MRLHLLSLLLAALTLAAVSAASQQEAETSDHLSELLDGVDEEEDDGSSEPEERSDDGGDACPPEPHTVTKRLAGKSISQATVQIQTAFGCKRVLQGGTPDKFEEADNCSSCYKRGSGLACVGAAMARSTKCKMVLGPDCHMYRVSPADPTQACHH